MVVRFTILQMVLIQIIRTENKTHSTNVGIRGETNGEEQQNTTATTKTLSMFSFSVVNYMEKMTLRNQERTTNKNFEV